MKTFAGHNTVDVLVDGQTVHLSNLQKIFWPEEGLRKGDVLEYYQAIAEVILPHFRDRPQSLHRTPDGVGKKGFFQKEAGPSIPTWVERVPIRAESNNRVINTVLIQNQASLLFLVNFGCVEFNPWYSRVGSLDRPDYLVLDLDPQDLPFERVLEVARQVRGVLDVAGAESRCKTSGQRGLHVCVPLGARYDYDMARSFAELIARVINSRLPDSTSLIRLPAQRRERVYIDYVQNGMGKTLASVYCVRPWPGAPVSAQLKWAEIRKGLDPAKFNLATMPRRIDSVGDLWSPMLGEGVDLAKCLERLATKFGGKK
jgi:bifunctional non-homologous end joining protein LigD